MKFKFLGALLLTIFAFAGTSCSKKGCGGGGWYGNRNLGFESTKKDFKTINKKDAECFLNSENCISANP